MHAVARAHLDHRVLRVRQERLEFVGRRLRCPRRREGRAGRADRLDGRGEQLVLGLCVGIGVVVLHHRQSDEEHRVALVQRAAHDVLRRPPCSARRTPAPPKSVRVLSGSTIGWRSLMPKEPTNSSAPGSSAIAPISSTQLYWSSLVSPVPFLALRISLTLSAKHLSFPRRRNSAPQRPSAMESPTKAIWSGAAASAAAVAAPAPKRQKQI